MKRLTSARPTPLVLIVICALWGGTFFETSAVCAPRKARKAKPSAAITSPTQDICPDALGAIRGSRQGYFRDLPSSDSSRVVSYVVAEFHGKKYLAVTAYGPHTHAIALQDLVRIVAFKDQGKTDIEVDVDAQTANVKIRYRSPDVIGGEPKSTTVRVGPDGVLKLENVTLKILQMGEGIIEASHGSAQFTSINETSGLANILKKQGSFKNDASQVTPLLQQSGFASPDLRVVAFNPDSKSGNHLDPELDTLVTSGNARHDFNAWLQGLWAGFDLLLKEPNPDFWKEDLSNLSKMLQKPPSADANGPRGELIEKTLKAYFRLNVIEALDISRAVTTMRRIRENQQVERKDVEILQSDLKEAEKEIRESSRAVEIQELAPTPN